MSEHSLREQRRPATYCTVTRGKQRWPDTVKNTQKLPISVQSQFLLLRASLQARMVHLMRTVPREALAAHMRRTDAAMWRAAAALLDLPPGVGEYGADMEGPDKACSTLGRQMMLPLRHGGLGMHMQSDEVSDAAFVAGAGQAERNLKGRPAALCPLSVTVQQGNAEMYRRSGLVILREQGLRYDAGFAVPVLMS